MEGSRRNSLSLPPLLALLSFLIISSLPPSSGDKCFVCSHDNKGCESELNSSSTAFIKDCKKGSVGCQVHAGVFEYPYHPYFYRDCMYKGYLECHKLQKPDWAKDKDKDEINFPERTNCMNSVRRKLGLREHYPRLQGYWARATTILYFRPYNGIPSGLNDYIQTYINQESLSNGIGIAGILKKRPNPSDLKIPGAYSCYNCDTQTGKCGGVKHEIIGNPPQEQCQTANGGAFGCMMLYTYNFRSIFPLISHKTRWMRRGCWYKGDLYCLKRINEPSWGSGRSGGPCPPPKGKGCDARKLIEKGQTAYWEEQLTLYREWDNETHEEIRNCFRNVRQRLGVTESLPELPEWKDARPQLDGTGLIYSLCAGRTLCNDEKSWNVRDPITKKPRPSPTTSTTTAPPPTTTDPSGGGGGTCPPEEEVDDPDCVCKGSNCSDSKEDDGWAMKLLVLVGVFVLVISLLGIGLWLYVTRGERVAPGDTGTGGYLADSYLPMQEVQWNSKKYPPGHQDLFQVNNSNSSMTDDTLAHRPDQGLDWNK